MKPIVDSLYVIVTRRDSRYVIIFSTIIFFLLLLVVQNGKASFDVFSFNFLPFVKRVMLFFRIFFDFKSTFTSSSLILATLGSFLGGINVSLAYTYMKIRGRLILKSGLYSGVGLVFAFLGVGCAACGTAFVSLILGFFGFSAMLHVLPYQGEEIGYVGLIFLCIATYSLSRKVAAPNVC